MDYCHNLHALAAVADFVKRSDAPRSIGVMTMPGDRRDDDLREFGALAAQTFDRIVIREDDDRRGRKTGEIAAVLYQAARDAGMTADRISVVLDEVEAVHAGIDLAAPGDLVVAMVDQVPLVWESIRCRLNRAAVPVNGASDPVSQPPYVPEQQEPVVLGL
jgi:cyanophycin synthetase